ncbi:gamma-glutamyltransferase [[Brevibacterium] frigoritolerans]|uniref:Gamma-glutamyltransferase n=1 Tax=Peribacillus frigoritolerans TaxID=450367 RepID=A0A941J214_9BACI|nr:gamma-glutamyltransferase [Peribacillus frigoritolerans]
MPRNPANQFIDYRESSPEDPSSRHDTGIPGLVAGMQVISDKYGSVPMADLLQPAIDLAEEGFEVNESLSSRLEAAQPRISSMRLHFFILMVMPLNQAKPLSRKKTC